MLNTWDFKPERESQAIKEYLSYVLLNGKLENTHIERIELQGRMVSAFIFDIPKDPLYFYVIVGVLDQNHNVFCSDTINQPLTLNSINLWNQS